MPIKPYCYILKRPEYKIMPVHHVYFMPFFLKNKHWKKDIVLINNWILNSPYYKDSFEIIILNMFKSNNTMDIDILFNTMDISTDFRFYIDILNKFHILSIEQSQHLVNCIWHHKHHDGLFNGIIRSIWEYAAERRYRSKARVFNTSDYVSRLEVIAKLMLWYIYNISITITKLRIDMIKEDVKTSNWPNSNISQLLDVKIDNGYVDLFHLLVKYGSITARLDDKFIKILAAEWNKFTYPWDEYHIPQ